MKFIIVRHAETKANVSRKIYGWTESDYSDRGEKQVERIVRYLGNRELDSIYSSPLPRAYKIAMEVSKEKDIPVIKVEALKEMNFGIFENMTYVEAEAMHKDSWNDFMNDYEKYPIPEGESFSQVKKRVGKFIDGLKRQDGKCLIVTHGGIVQALISCLLDMDTDHTWHFKIPPAMILEIEYKDNYGKMLKMLPIESTD